MNPYWGTDFWQFFAVFGKRMALFATGQLPFSQLASDEIQVLVLILIALSSALVGTFLVLKKMTMLANALSHTILLGIVGAYLLFAQGIGDLAIDLKTLIIAA